MSFSHISNAKSLRSYIAIGTSMVGILLCVIALLSKSWVMHDSWMGFPGYDSFGLWMYCSYLRNREWYDVTYDNCDWSVDSFTGRYFHNAFMAIRFWFCVCNLMAVYGFFCNRHFMYKNRSREYDPQILYTVGGMYAASAVSGTIALALFGVQRFGKEFEVYWIHHEAALGFVIAVVGVICMSIAAILYIVEGRVKSLRKKDNRIICDQKKVPFDY